MLTSLQTLDKKHRSLTIASWILMVASPFLILAAISLVIGQNAFLSKPVWTDELDYWRSIFSWMQVGSNAGYSGIGEMHALTGPLSVHGVTPLLLYLGYASLFGWSFNSIVIANCLWVSAGALLFCLLNKPKAGLALLITVGLMLYTPITLYAATAMTELANYGLLLFYLAFLVRLARTRKAAKETLGETPAAATGIVPLLLATFAVLLCCAYRITYIGLFIPLIVVACDFKWSLRMVAYSVLALVMSAGIYYATAMYASPFASGFLYNFMRTDSFSLSLQMFLSHAKANLVDYFIRHLANDLEGPQRILYCVVMGLSLLTTFVRLGKVDGKIRVKGGTDWFAALAFLMLFLPFGLVVCFYETNDWSDYRTLAPFLWLVVTAYMVRGRKLVPVLYLAGCVCITAVLLTGGPVGVFADEGRFETATINPKMQELCEAISYDSEARNPYTNTVRTDLFQLDTVASLHPGIGIQTGWFTPDGVGQSRWILTDHLKIPVEGYELVLDNGTGRVYQLTKSYEEQ